MNNEKQAKKLAVKPNFEWCIIFDENLIAIHMKKTCIVYDKPVYLGVCILDLSKTLMYDFHYNYIKKKYGEKAKLLFTDTDSFAYEIETEDFYKDISEDVEAKFDTTPSFNLYNTYRLNCPQFDSPKLWTSRVLRILCECCERKSDISCVGTRPCESKKNTMSLLM